MRGFLRRQWPVLVTMVLWITNAMVFIVKGRVPLGAYCIAVVALIWAYVAQIIYTERYK